MGPVPRSRSTVLALRPRASPRCHGPCPQLRGPRAAAEDLRRLAWGREAHRDRGQANPGATAEKAAGPPTGAHAQPPASTGVFTQAERRGTGLMAEAGGALGTERVSQLRGGGSCGGTQVRREGVGAARRPR